MGDSQNPVLVVDDDRLTSRYVEMLLNQSGYRSVVTHEPGQVLPLIDRHNPCLVLLDINMPGADGLKILEQIRERYSTPVVMLTGVDKSDWAVRALRLGASDYVTKPIEDRRLLAAVKEAVRNSIQPAGGAIGQYQLEEELGRGGMAVVYRARDVVLDRAVALKVPLPMFANCPEFERQFLVEARAAARLSHPGLVTIYEAGRFQAHLFLAMELLEGKTMAQLQESGYRFTIREALRTSIHLGETLRAVHATGLVHQDVKPANIMIQLNSRTKLLDFGLVRSMQAIGDANGFYTAGTPGYASPETYRGTTVDGRSDLYSLGVVLYEMLANDYAFEGNVMLNSIEGRLKRPVAEIPGAPRRLLALVEQMLHVEPEHRPASLDEALRILREIRARYVPERPVGA